MWRSSRNASITWWTGCKQEARHRTPCTDAASHPYMLPLVLIGPHPPPAMVASRACGRFRRAWMRADTIHAPLWHLDEDCPYPGFAPPLVRVLRQ